MASPAYQPVASPSQSPTRGSSARELFRSRTPKSFQNSLVDLHQAVPPRGSALGLAPSQLNGPPSPASQQQRLFPNVPMTSSPSLYGSAVDFIPVPAPNFSSGLDINDDHVELTTEYDRMIGTSRQPPKKPLAVKVWDAARKHWIQSILAVVALVLCIVLISRSKFSPPEANSDPSKTSPINEAGPKPIPPPPKPPASNLKTVQLEDLFTGALYPQRSSITWLHGGIDGDFVFQDLDTGSLIVEHIETSERQTLIEGDHVTGPDGQSIAVSDDFTISADRKYILLSTNKEKLWRHSYTAEYIIYNVATKTTMPLSTSGRRNAVQVAKWAPSGHSIAFVRDNDLYIVVHDSAADKWTETRITFDGSPTVLNGVPDWVYEEEVLATNYAFWWSPAADAISWLRFNDTNVPLYSFPYFWNPTTRQDTPYPTQVQIRYPKPGYTNPKVSLHLYSLTKSSSPTKATPLPSISFDLALGGDDMIYGSVIWVGPSMLVKLLNRIQNVQKVVAVTIKDTDLKVQVVRERSFSSGWIEILHQLTPIQTKQSQLENTTAQDPTAWSYLDIVDKDGYNHLAWFPSALSSEPVFLTRGSWEVIGIKGVDIDSRTAYFMTTLKGSTSRTLCKARYGNDSATASPSDSPELVDTSLPPGFYTTQFSQGAKYFWAAYDGPNVPWQAIRKVNNSTFNHVLQDNHALSKSLENYAMPMVNYTTIPVPKSLQDKSTIDLNAVIYYPANFDPSKKYPVFMRVYGGPNSQLVQQRFEVDLHTYLTSTRQVICVIVDGRGTGFRGREFRSAVYKNLGEVEATDQTNAAKWLAAQPWVDSTKIGIWGWSYGGFMACKITEMNADSNVFKYAIAVAPVTDWRFYDSIYTERYMQLPKDNPQGYKQSAITNMTGFKRTQFLLVHGTGDDNVHVQQSIYLIRKLQMSAVHAYRVQFWPDSDHSMNFNNAYRELYALIDRWIGRVVFGEDEYQIEPSPPKTLDRRAPSGLRIEAI